MNIIYQFHWVDTIAVLYACCCCSVAQSCLILCDPLDCSMLGSSVHRDFQAGILDSVTTSFSKGSLQIRYQIHVSYTCRWILYNWVSPGKCIVWLGWDYLFRNYQIVFQSRGIILNSHQQQTHFLLLHVLINNWHCQVVF